MNENEIKEAIERKKFAVDNLDKFVILILSITSLFFLYLCVKCFTENRIGTAICLFIMGSAYCGFSLFRIFNNKKLFPYMSTLSYDRKTRVLEDLIKEPQIETPHKLWKDRNEKRIYFSFTYKKSFIQNYEVRILYDPMGYYINSNIGFAQSHKFSSDNANEIVSKIKEIEASVKLNTTPFPSFP
jgi:hypothetical protein